MKDESINWEKLNTKYHELMGGGPLQPGRMYRAITIDGDICEGLLTLCSGNIIELQIGSCFRSFNRRNTQLIKIDSTDTTYN